MKLNNVKARLVVFKGVFMIIELHYDKSVQQRI